MAKKCARTFSIVVEKGKKSILEVRHLLPDALPRSVRPAGRWRYPIVVRLSLATVCASRPVTGDRQCEPACRWRWLLRAWVRLAVGSANHAATSRVDAHCGHR
jgi:hypothetical protein